MGRENQANSRSSYCKPMVSVRPGAKDTGWELTALGPGKAGLSSWKKQC